MIARRPSVALRLRAGIPAERIELAGQADEAARAGDYARAADLAEAAGCTGAAQGYRLQAIRHGEPAPVFEVWAASNPRNLDDREPSR